MMSQILLTGSNGFIGSSLINYIEVNSPSELDNIVVLSSVQHSKLKTIIYNSNTYSIPKINEVSDIIHIGAFTPKSNAETNDVEKCTTNILFTLNLLNNIPKTLNRFVFTSTLDIYESTNKKINEDSIVNPTSLYAWSKLYCEKIIKEWCYQHNVLCIILRLGHIYGSGEDAYKKLIPETIKKIIQNTSPVIYTNGLEKRSFLHVNDCVRCIWNSIDVNTEERIINIVSGNSKTVTEIVGSLIDISGKPFTPQILNNKLATTDFIFDSKRMIKVFGEEKISFNDGLIEEYRYFLNKKT